MTIDTCSIVFVSTGHSTSSLAMLDEMARAPSEMSSTTLFTSRSVPSYSPSCINRDVETQTHFNYLCNSPHPQSKEILDLAPDTALPTGKLTPIPKSRDFSSPKKIGADFPEGGLDDYWVFQRGPGKREVMKGGEAAQGDVFEDIHA